jgi:hypothetical protein
MGTGPAAQALLARLFERRGDLSLDPPPRKAERPSTHSLTGAHAKPAKNALIFNQAGVKVLRHTTPLRQIVEDGQVPAPRQQEGDYLSARLLDRLRFGQNAQAGARRQGTGSGKKPVFPLFHFNKAETAAPVSTQPLVVTERGDLKTGTAGGFQDGLPGPDFYLTAVNKHGFHLPSGS